MKVFNKVILFSFFLITMLFNHSIFYQIIVALLIICAIVECVLRGKLRFHWFFTFYLAFMAYIYWQITSGMVYDKSESIRLASSVAINILVYYALFNFIIHGNFHKEALKYYVDSTFISSFILIAITISSGNLFSGRLMFDSTITIAGIEMDYNSNAIANYCCLSSTILVFCKSFFPKEKRLVYLVFFVFVILITGSRRGLLLFLLAVFVKHLNFSNMKRIAGNTLWIAIAFIFISYLIMKIPFLYNIMGERFVTMFDFIKGGGGDDSIVARADYLNIGWEIFQSHFMFGVGIGNFMSFAKTAAYSHNDYIELLSGCGIIGCFLAYLPKISVFINNLQTKSELRALYAILMIQLFVAAFGTVSYYKREDWLLFIVAMAYLAYTKKAKYIKTNGV